MSRQIRRQGSHLVFTINPINKLGTCTGGHLIIGRNSRFFSYFVTTTRKNTEKILEDSRSTQALSDSILWVMVKTYPCQNVPNQNVPSFGQNVPTFLVKTYPVHQNVPNLLVKTYPIYFFLIFYIYFYFFVEKSYLHIGLNVPNIYFSKLLIYSSIICC